MTADLRAVPVHHPSEARLLDYASGALPEPMALLIATHLALCPACRRTVAELEAVGGALLEALPPEPVADDSLARLLARLDRLEPAAPAAPASLAAAPILPQPLRDYVGSLDQVAWRHFGPVAEARLLTGFEQVHDAAAAGQARGRAAAPHPCRLGADARPARRLQRHRPATICAATCPKPTARSIIAPSPTRTRTVCAWS